MTQRKDNGGKGRVFKIRSPIVPRSHIAQHLRKKGHHVEPDMKRKASKDACRNKIDVKEYQ